MRRRNWRFVVAGFFLINMVLVFFLFMQSIAIQSTDPATFMQIAGAVSGTMAGISVALIIIGLMGRRA